MKTILITMLALCLGVSAVLAETKNPGSPQLAGQSSTGKSKPANDRLKGNGSGPARSVPKGVCCAKVNNHCVTICGKAGGCTGSGDCITNPN